MRRRRRRRRKSALPRILLTIAVIVLVVGMMGGYFLYQRYSYGTARADISDWFEAGSPDAFPMIINGVNVEKKARSFDGAYYMSLEDVHTHISNRFYYGEEDGIFVYSTPTDLITNTVGTGEARSTDGTDYSLTQPVTRLEDGALYVNMAYLARFYDVTWEAFSAPNRMIVTIDTFTAETALVNRKTHLRYRGGVKSDILCDLDKDARVIFLDETEDEWVKVRTEDGFAGYVESKRLEARESFTYGADTLQEPVYPSISKPYKINLAWHQVFAEAGNDTLREVCAPTKGLNTISPTWFALSDNTGAFSSLGSAGYVQEAHAMGMEVWILVSNFANAGIDTRAVLSRAASRAKLTEGLVAETKRLGADGINVDFEEVPQEAGRDYIQWIRELSIACRREQLVLSIDNYVPMGFNDYYDRREQGIVADYVIIMGYDEHYGGSPVAGSVASIEYVRNGIEATCAQVAPEKVINAVPFYTRLWTTDGSNVTSVALGMDAARQNAADYGMSLTWNAETEQYYGSVVTGNGSLVELWMEDKESLEAKIAVMRANNIAGIAAWKLGLESADVWDVIEAYVNGG